MAIDRRPKDFYKLSKNIASFSDNQAKITKYDDDLSSFEIAILPGGGLYKGGCFRFMITLPEEYGLGTNDYPPNVQCLTKLFHPNIDTSNDYYVENGDSNVCLNLLDEWTSSNDLEDLVMGLLFLFYNPEVEDALSPYFGHMMNKEQFEEGVRSAMHGESVDGFEFDYCLVEDLSKGVVKTNEDINNQQNKTTILDCPSDVFTNGAKYTWEVEVWGEGIDAESDNEDGCTSCCPVASLESTETPCGRYEITEQLCSATNSGKIETVLQTGHYMKEALDSYCRNQQVCEDFTKNEETAMPLQVLTWQISKLDKVTL